MEPGDVRRVHGPLKVVSDGTAFTGHVEYDAPSGEDIIVMVLGTLRRRAGIDVEATMRGLGWVRAESVSPKEVEPPEEVRRRRGDGGGG